MGVFNLQEETNIPGYVALKLCEGKFLNFLRNFSKFKNKI